MNATRYDPGLHADQRDCLCLHRNENLFVGRDWTVDRARELLEGAALASYPDPRCVRLRGALAALYGVEPANVFVGNGSDEVLAALFGVLRSRYDCIHRLDVGFGVYPLLARRYGYALATLPGDTFETGEVRVDGFGGLAVVDSPNAITGVRLSGHALAALAAAPGAFLVWDNVYGEFAGDRVNPPLTANVAVVRSFSKFYALAGLRVGYCLAEAGLVAKLEEWKDVFNVNALAQAMALDALSRRDRFEAAAGEVVAHRGELAARLRAIGLVVREGDANFVLARHPAVVAERLQRELVERQVAVRWFPDPPAADYVRITVPPRGGIDRLVAALSDVLAEVTAPGTRKDGGIT